MNQNREDQNWPAPTSRFLTQTMAIDQKAWDNRTHPNIYRAFSKILNTPHLYSTVDRWGIMRGTKNLAFQQGDATTDAEVQYQDRLEWQNTLSVHWDWNPWLLVPAVKAGAPKVYQGILALDDCPEQVGGFLAVAGSARYTQEQWVYETKQYNDTDTIVRNQINRIPLLCPFWRKSKLFCICRFQTRLAPHDPMNQFLSKIPVRKGDMIIFDGFTVHATFPNTSDRLRLVQYIRMMPATPECEKRDNMVATRVLKEDAEAKRALQRVELSELGRQLLGLQPWKS